MAVFLVSVVQQCLSNCYPCCCSIHVTLFDIDVTLARPIQGFSTYDVDPFFRGDVTQISV